MIVDRLVHGIRNTTYRNPDKWLLEWFWGGVESDSGVHVGPKQALSYAPYFQAIIIISGDIGKIPLYEYQRTDTGREKARKEPAYRLMVHEFNEAMTADVGMQILQSHALSWGNGRGAILRDNAGTPLAIVPLLPDRTKTVVENGEVWHITKVGDEQKEKTYRDENVLHIKGLGFDGITGYSVAHLARNSLGVGLAAEKHGSNLFKNGAVPALVLETDGKLRKEDAQQLLQDWNKAHAGTENFGNTGILHSGVKAHTLTMPSRDSQWFETRKFQRQEIASWFNLPPHKLGDDTRISYNSLEQENLSYYNGCLLFWFVRWQMECRRKLLTEKQKENDSHYFEFFVDILASVDFPAKVAALRSLVDGTIFNPNEAREKLNMNHRPGGDKYENPNTNSREQIPAKPIEPERKRKPPTPEEVADKVLPQIITFVQSQESMRGPQGRTGEPGTDGTNGKDGRDGVDGCGISAVRIVEGSLAVDFTNGTSHFAGTVVGECGKPGSDGRDGKDGSSAYEIAAANGFLGTNEEWLASLIGPKGDSGPQGNPGAPSLYGRCLDSLSAAIEQEASIVRHHAEHAKNFIGWYETWYPKWQAKFAAELKRLGADETLATEHCQESQRQLLGLTERVTQETLAAETRLLTAAWHERAVVLARQIAGGELPNAPLELETIVTTARGLGTVAAIESDWRYQVEFGDGTLETLAGGEMEVLG